MTDIKEPKDASQQVARLPQRNIFSFIAVSWINPLFKIGMKSPLKEVDLPDLPENERYAASAAVLEPFWAECRGYWRMMASISKTEEKKDGAPKPPSLAMVFLRHFGSY
ncbi:hypothetical protein BC829DRAFT_450573 [Chytridium lagenaria]|nr:hypothetical protein BC829DRAFT_450573 [Chytridium lagenaria]